MRIAFTKVFFLTLIAGIFFLSFSASAQINRKNIKKNNKRMSNFKGRKSNFSKEKAYTATGFSLNALNYYGDLAPRPGLLSTDISFTRPALGVSLLHRFGPRYTVTANFMYGTLSGSDAASADAADISNGVYRYKRNLSFRNRIKELSVIASLDLFENQATYISRVPWTPYAWAGIALFHHNPKAQVPSTDLNGQPLPGAGEWVSLQPLGTEGQYADLLSTDVNYGIEPYKLIQVAIPFGLGARFRLNEVMDISAEIGWRYLFTDYLDDVSRNYVDLDVLDSELARAMSYRSNETEFISNAQPVVARNGNTYDLLPGYGQEFVDNLRGSSKDRDIYMVTTFRLTYILGKTFHKAKFR